METGKLNSESICPRVGMGSFDENIIRRNEMNFKEGVVETCELKFSNRKLQICKSRRRYS